MVYLYQKENLAIFEIPVAEDCGSTLALRKDKIVTLKDFTYFDWVIISPWTVLKLFQTEFHQYCEKENLRLWGFNTDRANMFHDVATDVLYGHHFQNLDKDYKKVREGMDIMIEKMYERFKANETIHFYYMQTKSVGVRRTKMTYGLAEMKAVFPVLQDFLLKRFSYASADDIQLFYSSPGSPWERFTQ